MPENEADRRFHFAVRPNEEWIQGRLPSQPQFRTHHDLVVRVLGKISEGEDTPKGQRKSPKRSRK